jgi:hypothetical protein
MPTFGEKRGTCEHKVLSPILLGAHIERRMMKAQERVFFYISPPTLKEYLCDFVNTISIFPYI